MPIKLSIFAKELRDADPELVDSVLKKELPILKHKIMRLDQDDEVTSNFSYNLVLQDKAEQAFRDFGAHRMPEEEFEKMYEEIKKNKENLNLIIEDWNDLHENYQIMKKKRSALSQ